MAPLSVGSTQKIQNVLPLSPTNHTVAAIPVPPNTPTVPPMIADRRKVGDPLPLLDTKAVPAKIGYGAYQTPPPIGFNKPAAFLAKYKQDGFTFDRLPAAEQAKYQKLNAG